MRRITTDLLREKAACSKQVSTFAELFPEGSDGSLADCLKAAQAGLDLDWAAGHLLSTPALDAFHKVMAPSLAAYLKAVAKSRDAYHKDKAPALADYEKVEAKAWAAFQKASGTALAAAFAMDAKGAKRA